MVPTPPIGGLVRWIGKRVQEPTMRVNVDLRPSRPFLGAGIVAIAVAFGLGAVSTNAPSGSAPVDAAGAVSLAQDLVPADLGLVVAKRNPTGARRPLGLLRGLIGRTERAEITITTGQGIRTILYVRGGIAAVSPGSITITLKDGSRQAFAIDADTRVREQGKVAKVADLAAGERAMVFGLRNGDGTYTARLIRCVRPAVTPPGASAAPSAAASGG
jgi:hypothetical protein